MKKGDFASYAVLVGAFLVVGVAAFVYFKTDRQMRQQFTSRVEAFANGERPAAQDDE
jgi:CHASE1-domain containing sensor protein